MSIQPLPLLRDEEELKAIAKLRPPETVVVRYGYLKQIGEFRYEGTEIPGCGTKMVVRTPRGVELAEMLTTVCNNSGCGHSISRQKLLDYIDQSGGKQYPFTDEGKVLRIATPDDLRDQAHLDSHGPEYVRAGREIVRDLDLPMKVVAVESLLGGERVVFYFMSENRVDFRDLVKRLAGELHTRIEMRQVGARDEARIVADYEKCGQQCCCKQFLKVLKPVSMKNAKIQKATLDPTKISGRCGRLMCCLRYEEVTYDELRKRLPPRNSKVMTPDGSGTVLNTQILTQLVLVELADRGERNAYPVENIERLTRDQEREMAQLVEDRAHEREERDARRESREQRRRPQPGQPLRSNEIESREGEASGELPDEPATNQTDDDAMTEQDTPGSAPGSSPGSSPGSAPENEAGHTEGDAGDGEPGGAKRRRKRRRRRRRGAAGQPPADSGNTPPVTEHETGPNDTINEG